MVFNTTYSQNQQKVFIKRGQLTGTLNEAAGSRCFFILTDKSTICRCVCVLPEEVS